jgi:hypothetical protein
MHADDTNYTVVKNGVVVVSDTGPAIRVESRRGSRGHEKGQRDAAETQDD